MNEFASLHKAKKTASIDGLRRAVVVYEVREDLMQALAWQTSERHLVGICDNTQLSLASCYR